MTNEAQNTGTAKNAIRSTNPSAPDGRGCPRLPVALHRDPGALHLPGPGAQQDGDNQRADRQVGARAAHPQQQAARDHWHLGQPAVGELHDEHGGTPFGALRQSMPSLLNIGYAKPVPRLARRMILLHGWTYDIHSYVDVAPLLAAKGYRVIVPYLRGYGSTRFLSAHRPGMPSSPFVAVDVIALMDALKMHSAIVAGYDWGARTADVVTALAGARQGPGLRQRLPDHHLERRTGKPLPPQAEWSWWYQ